MSETNEVNSTELLCTPKIVQLLLCHNDNQWQGRLLGLGSDGVTYECGPKGAWVPFIPPLEHNKEISTNSSVGT